MFTKHVVRREAKPRSRAALVRSTHDSELAYTKFSCRQRKQDSKDSIRSQRGLDTSLPCTPVSSSLKMPLLNFPKNEYVTIFALSMWPSITD